MNQILFGTWLSPIHVNSVLFSYGLSVVEKSRKRKKISHIFQFFHFNTFFTQLNELSCLLTLISRKVQFFELVAFPFVQMALNQLKWCDAMADEEVFVDVDNAMVNLVHLVDKLDYQYHSCLVFSMIIVSIFYGQCSHLMSDCFVSDIEHRVILQE